LWLHDVARNVLTNHAGSATRRERRGERLRVALATGTPCPTRPTRSRQGPAVPAGKPGMTVAETYRDALNCAG
jgi:hypothetical protein